jgi:hypothetical protein
LFNFFFYYFYSLLFNLFSFLKTINYHECRCRRWTMFLKASQCLFKSFSHKKSTSQCLKNFPFYICFFSRIFTTLLKYRRWSWCKRFNVNCPNCSTNFLY